MTCSKETNIRVLSRKKRVNNTIDSQIFQKNNRKMPSTCCCAPHCHQRAGHVFPANEEMRQKWIRAIKRLNESILKDWQPSDHIRCVLEIFCQFALSWTKNSHEEDSF